MKIEERKLQTSGNNPPLGRLLPPGVKAMKDGRFAVDLVKCVDGKRTHIYSSGFLTAEDALLAMPGLIERKTKSKEEGGNITFEEFISRYEKYRLLHVRKSTFALTKSILTKHFSSLSSIPVNEAITYERIKKSYEDILSAPGTQSWKNRCFGALRQMIGAAYKWKYIGEEANRDCLSLLENIPENRGEKKEKLIWTKKEKVRFLSAIEDNADKTMFVLFIALGAMIGEFMGLTWDCFDERKGTIRIKQQLIYQSVGKWVLSKQLKTRESYRECRLSSSVCALLKEHRKNGSGEGFIFTIDPSSSEPLSKGSFRRRMAMYIEKAKVRKITPHAIRHAKATELMRVCRNMQEVKAAARFLGHSATMMIDTYGHYERSAQDALLKRLEKDEEEIFEQGENGE